jgi:hypothetical protein
MLTDAQISRISRQTSYSVLQIKNYIERVATDDAVMEENIRESDMFGIDIDLLGR